MAKLIASNLHPSAWIVSSKDRGRKSIKNGIVYLKNNHEFEIELYNPLTISVLSEIKLNGSPISKSGLILKPGQRVYLDCFIDDKRKFIFKTYEVENIEESLEAIKNNGLLEVYFYKEDVITLTSTGGNTVYYPKYYPNYYPNYPNWNGDICYCSSFGTGIKTTSYTNSIDINTSNSCNYTNSIDLNNVETGRVEKGDVSSQKFKEVFMKFENYYISSTIIKILPDSQKPLEAKDIRKNSVMINKKKEDDLNNVKLTDSTNIVELIKKLSDLHKSGIITDSEFLNKKSELLSRI
jgi:hypothetical protein